MILKLEATAGSDIKECFAVAIRTASTLNLTVEFNFNDVTCLASPNGDILRGINSYYIALDSIEKYKYAIS